MQAATRFLLLAFLLGLAPRVSAQEPDLGQLQEQLARVQLLGNSAPSRMFFEMAKGRDAESFATLKDAIKSVTHEKLTVAAYGAFALFKGSPIESNVSTYLSRQSFKGPNAAHQLGATQALTYFWQSAESELLRILRQHPMAVCRWTALEPVTPRLVASGGRSSCQLLLSNSTGEGSNRAALVAALRHMVSPEEVICMVSYLRKKKTVQGVKLALLDVLSERDGDIPRVAIERRLHDDDESVRLRALKLVAQSADMKQLLKLRSVVQTGSTEFVVRAMLVLAEVRKGDPEWVSELYSFARDQSRAVRLGAVEALGLIPTRPALNLLHKLLKDKELEVRLAAVEQVGQQHQLESVPKLIKLIGGPRDLYSHKVVRCLRLITGEDHGYSQTRWKSWFEAEGASFQLPTAEECLALEQERHDRRNASSGTSASFYELEIVSTKLCFVIDTSGSMAFPANGRGTSARSNSTTRMEVAKKELANAFNQLLDGVRFNVVTFATLTSSYRKDLVGLTTGTRKKVLKYIDKIQPIGGTAIYDALELALEDKEIDTIYLLTDGVPTEGKIVAKDAILARVEELTRGRRIQIHGIAIGQPSSLLKALAENHGGQYTVIR